MVTIFLTKKISDDEKTKLNRFATLIALREKYAMEVIPSTNKHRRLIMATNPIGKGTKTIGINMSQSMSDELEKRSKSMGISTGMYCKTILRKWIESGEKLQLSEK
jgi:predicted ATP-dependent protease